MEEPKGTPYKGPSGIGRDSVWLTAEDLVEGKDLKVKIESTLLYKEVKFLGGRTRKNYTALRFVGKERVLGVNATARKLLNKAFGGEMGNWWGKEITLYVAETQLAGETVKCVRIRDQGARAATAAEQFLAGDDEPTATPAGNGIDDPATREQLLLGDEQHDAAERGDLPGDQAR